MKSITRRSVLGTCAAMALAPRFTQAQSSGWPVRPVRIIVPVAAGTATDLTARIFGDKLSTSWGVAVVVENKPGADGLLAIGGFVSGRDDHTLLFSFSTAVSLNPLVHAKLPYDPAVDLVPITTTAEVLFAVAAHRSVAATSLAELSIAAKAAPDTFNWAAAPGLPRFVFERYLRELGLDMSYVGYHQTGSAVQDLGEGRIQVMIAAVNTLLPVVENGKARLLVIAAADRAATVLSVPHAVEAGFPSLVVPAIGCAYGWKGMTADLRDRLAKDIDTVAQDTGVVAQIAKVGQVVRRSSPAVLAKLLLDQRVDLAPLAAIMAGVK